MVLPQKVIVELSDADRRLLKRIAVALEGPLPPTFSGDASRRVLLEESTAAQEDDSVLFPTVGLDGVVRHV